MMSKPIPTACFLGFDKRTGEMVSAAWVDQYTSEREARNFCRQGGNRAIKRDPKAAREIMKQHGWGA